MQIYLWASFYFFQSQTFREGQLKTNDRNKKVKWNISAICIDYGGIWADRQL